MHICDVCFAPSDLHPEECEWGHRHFPPLCCPGCGCESFERSHTEADKPDWA